ncbi:MAG: TlpA family protein disulfide reductase, partial [Limisphaerales bacterium]
VVSKPDGSAAADVTVYLTDMRNGVYLSGEPPEVRDHITRGTEKVKTDAEGRFSFKPKVDAYSFIVVDESGFAEVPVRDASQEFKIQLQPWARIAGRLLIGDRAGAREEVRLWPDHLPHAHEPRNFPPLQLFLDTITDDEGNFVFNRVPPVGVQVYHSPKVRDSRMGTTPMSQTTNLLLKPGETRKVTIGGVGRPVIGRLVVEEYEGTIDWRSDVHTLERILPNPPGLPDLRELSREFSEAMRGAETDEEKAAASEAYKQRREAATAEMKAFYQTDAGRQHHAAKGRYALNFAQDGSFRVEDVPGGQYTLRITLREPSANGSFHSGPIIANLEKTIEVPASPGGRSDEPFDLGVIPLTARKTMKVGKVAPDFEVATLDGGKVKLSDLRGKYVLLDFWAVWCGPCVAETPNLKATWEAFKDDPRFAFIALSLDPDASTARKYVEKNELGWTQAWLGEWSKTDLPGKYGVEGIPAIFLVDPEGKIAATGLRGPAIESTVRSKLRSTE